MTTTNRDTLLNALHTFAHQRPRLEYGNYGDPTSYRAEVRDITKTLHDARHLLRAVELRGSISAADILAGFDAFSGRLSWIPDTNGGGELDYCTGQYWPTEYRRAVCAVLASVLWSYARRNLEECGEEVTGEKVRKEVRRAVGRKLQERWAS